MRLGDLRLGLAAIEARLRARPVVSVILASALAFLVIGALTGHSLWRPYDFGDDLTWEYDPGDYLADKVPSEARWLVYWWRSILGVWPRAADFNATLALWCGTAGILGRALAGPSRPLLGLLTAVAVAACPPVLNMLQWPHTSAPMMAVLFAAVAGSAATQRRPRAFLAIAALGALATALTYQAFTILYAAAVIAMVALEGLREHAPRGRMLARFALAAAALGLGAAAGVLTGYALNLHAFGHFGLQIDDWRLDDETDRRRFAIALHSARDTLLLLTRQTWGVAPALLAAAMAGLGVRAWRDGARHRPGSALIGWLILALVAGLAAAPFLLPFVAGVGVPKERAGPPLWLMTIVAVLACLGARQHGRRMAMVVGALGLLCVTGLASGAWPYAAYSRVEARDARIMDAIAADFRKAAPAAGVPKAFIIGDSPLYGFVNGPYQQLQPWWVQILFDRTFTLGDLPADPTYCAGDPDVDDDDCATLLTRKGLPALQAMPAYPQPGYIQRRGKVMVVKIGPVSATDDEES